MNYMPIIYRGVPYDLHIGHGRSGYIHWHYEMELLFCLQSTMTVETPDATYTLSAGDMIVLPSYRVHSAQSFDPDRRWAAVNFGSNLLGDSFNAIQHLFLLVRSEDPSAPAQLRFAIRNLLDILRKGIDASREAEWRIRGDLLLICDYLRTIAHTQPQPRLQAKHSQLLQNLYKVVLYVKQHYGQRITVDQMADLAGYSKSCFCKQFKQITGVSFYQYLISYRLQLAGIRLRSDDAPISAVAVACGFSNASLFYRAFKTCTGVSPTAYRRMPAGPEVSEIEERLQFSGEKKRPL